MRKFLWSGRNLLQGGLTAPWLLISSQGAKGSRAAAAARLALDPLRTDCYLSDQYFLFHGLQVLHVHVFLAAPLGASHMPQPGANRHQSRVTIWESTPNLRSLLYLIA